jgi:hypothetical protein
MMAGAIGIALTVLGGTVSSTKPWHKPAFISPGVTSLIIAGWIGIRAFKESKVAVAATEHARQQSQRAWDGLKNQLNESEVIGTRTFHNRPQSQNKLAWVGALFRSAVGRLVRPGSLDERRIAL